MGQRGHAWVTCVTRSDKGFVRALVLAESLRRTKTTKRIAVIVTSQVGCLETEILHNAFDDVFCLNDNLIVSSRTTSKEQDSDNGKDDELRGRIFAFSLEVYEKCVFLSPDTMILENCDKLFEETRFSRTYFNGQSDKMFLFTPKWVVCKFLKNKYEENMSHTTKDFWNTFIMTSVQAWMTNNELGDSFKGHVELSAVKFSMKTGRGAGTTMSHGLPSVVQFVDAELCDKEFVGVFHQLKSEVEDLGLLEQVIISTWLDMVSNGVSRDMLELKPRIWPIENYKNEPIAIVGMSCRLPKANNLEEFWNLLYEGKEGTQQPPSFRWRKEHSIFGGSGKERNTRAGFLSTPVDEFDAKFFGLSPKEALFLDPQARLLHELVWEGLENSGIDPLSLRGSHVGIFTGSWLNDYKDLVQTSTEKDFFRTYMGNSGGVTPARLSFMLGVTGPSIATESGCSSAIVAVDMAVKSLRNVETNLAIAGGVNLLLHPFHGDLAEYVVSPDGRCKTFDADANGFARAEGCGVLVLKRLSDAIQDGDNIWATIRGSGTSQEGLSRSLGTPTVHCESLAMKLALEDADVMPEQVSFVETHGTGTIVGDPMEIAAITQTYGSRRRASPLVIGSVKTNVGHTESCSGITGIIKTVLAMHHEIIPKHLNLETINPEINLDAIPARIPLEPLSWPKKEGAPRLAGVSSFGITGTDAHVVIQEPPNNPELYFKINMERSMHFIKFSGKTVEALADLLSSYEKYFSQPPTNISFADVAYTANTGRASFSHRAFLLASDFEQAAKSLRDDKFMKGETRNAEKEKICFLFTGQGSQYSGMAKSLYDSSTIFRLNFEYCDSLLSDLYNLSIMDVLWGKSSQQLTRTIYSQTSIFCIEYCLLKLWESWGIRPDYVLGHSLGEFCAVVAAGIISFEDALKLVVMRSKLIDQLETGSMLVIKANLKDVEQLLQDKNILLDIAAVNSSEQTVVAGDTEKILHLLDLCKMRSIKAVKLEATHAFHSRHMEPILNEYKQVANTIMVSNDSSFHCQYVSGMDGKLIEDPSKDINAEYWIRHTREKVSFQESCRVLKRLGCQNYLEIGPQPVLSTFVMQNIELSSPINCYPSLRRNISDWETILTSLGKLYLEGYPINWEGFDKPYMRKRIPSLPTYPFQRKSFWVDCSDTNVAPIHPLIGHHISNASPLNIFHSNLSPKAAPHLKDHCIGNRIVLPGAAFAEMCLSAGYCVANSLRDHFELPTRPIALENMKIEAPLELKNDKTCRVQVIVELPSNSGDNTNHDEAAHREQQGFCVKIFHQKNSDTDTNRKWILHANATFHLVPSTNELVTKWNFGRIAEMIREKECPVSNGFYKRISDVGLQFGDSYKSIIRHWRVEDETGNDEIVAEMSIPLDHDNYILHPVITDAMLQTGLLSQLRSQTEVLRVPVRLGKLIWLGNVKATGNKKLLYLHAWWSKEIGKCSILVVNEDLTTPVAFLSDFELIETNARTIESLLEQQNSSLPDVWEEVWKPIIGPHSNRATLSSIEPVFSTEEFLEKVNNATKLNAEDWNCFKNMNQLIYYYILNTLIELGWSPIVGDEVVVEDFCKNLKILPMYQKLVTFYFSVFCDENLMEYNDTKNNWKITSIPLNNQILVNEIQGLEKSLENNARMKTALKFNQNIASSLPQLLIGNESPIQLFLPTDHNKQDISIETYYQNHPGRPDFIEKVTLMMESAIQGWRQISGEDSSKMLRILEVGAGTGSTAEVLLPGINNKWGNNFEYYYTDISAAFFSKAAKKLEEFQKNLKYAVFNIEENPLKQGIPLNYFDIVIAQNVIHATRSLKESMKHLKATLRPQGTVIIAETISSNREITFSFGLFEHYWRFQDYDIRPNHPCVNISKWKQVLHETGFNYSYATEAYFGTFGGICGEAPPSSADDTQVVGNLGIPDETKENISRWIVFSSQNNEVVTRNVCNKLKQCGNRVTLMLHGAISEHDGSLDEVSKLDLILGRDENVQGILYAVGMDCSTTDQNTISRPLLHIIKKLLDVKKPPRLYILTCGVHAINGDAHLINNPSCATMFGMVKSLKNENSDLFVRYIDMDQCSNAEIMTEQILYELALHKESKEKDRVQIVYRDEQRYEPKFTKCLALGHQGSGDELKLPPCSERYQLILPQSRLIQDLEFDVLEQELLPEDEVEVKVEAYSLNFRDIVTILKPIAEFEKLNAVGVDFSGVITRVGESLLHTQNKFKVGDRVFGISYKDNCALQSHLVLDTKRLLKIPERMTFCEAASLPAVFATSLHCLVNLAQLQEGDTVLIHTGSGGVGLSAIQVARNIGARIITTAGNKRKRRYLRENLGIEHVFHSRDTSFEKEIMKVTNGRGVDVVLNSITGPGMKEASLNVCSKGARFVEMSKLSVWSEEEVKALRPDVKYTIVDVTKIDIDCWINLSDSMEKYLNEGRVTVLPFVKFDALRIKPALQYFQKAHHIGKVLVTMPKVTRRDGEWITQVPLFNEESTYIITGGLGGIGFEVCKWMLGKGATDIVLIGRNPPKPEIAKEIERLKNDKKCNLVVKLGDVGDFETCKAIIENLKESSCKPIRGIQHCAGLLRNNLYFNQIWEDFDATFNPKVKGTWNLHNLTKGLHLEHFVLYSSIAANFGSPGQSNHSAANCFEDTFAHYRYSLGLPSTSINWGQWAQVGCAKDTNVTGVQPVSVQHMLKGLEMTLRTNKVRVAIANFESFISFIALCPYFKHYIDERLLKNNSKQTNLSLPRSDKFWEEMDSAESEEEKMEVACRYIKSLLRSALRMEPDEPISEDADLQELGVDSLMAIEIKNSLQGIMGSRLTLTTTMLKDTKTVRDVATLVVAKVYDEDEINSNQASLSPEEYERLLNDDCKLDNDIQAPLEMYCKISAMKTVLITGVSGQFGPYILSVLSQNEAFETLNRIVCLIRVREEKCPEEKLRNILVSMKLTEKVDMGKVECVRSDVTLPNFGLEHETYSELCASVDGIIHLAAKSNHIECYRRAEKGTRDIRSVNVGGTLNVIRFAATTKTKHVYYAGVIGSTFSGNDEGTLSDDWPEHCKIKAVVEHNVVGYLVTKYVCEMLLNQANERGIPCKVFRLPWITGESETGRVNYKSNHYLLRFLSYLKIKSIPDAPIPAVVLPVDVCAELSLKLFCNDETPNGIFNIAHPRPGLEVEFVQVAKEHFGVELEIVDWKSKEFVEKLYATDMPLEALKEIYQDVDRAITVLNSGAFQGIQGYLAQPENFFINKKVEKYMSGFSANIPTSTMDTIRRSLEFVRSEGLFAKYGL